MRNGNAGCYAVNKQLTTVVKTACNRCSQVTCRLARVHADRSGLVPLS